MIASVGTQRVLLWWTLAFSTLFGNAWIFLLHMVPLPDARFTAEQVAHFYQQYGSDIRIGATVASWTSGYMVPFTVVIAIQMMRLEKGFPIWSILQLVGGALTTIFLVLPPMFWGVAAYDPYRAIDVTALMNQLANLSLATADQYYMFQNIPVALIAIISSQRADSAFPRWYGYFTILATLIIEVGPLAFLVRSGPFAWNGLLVFWFPFFAYFAWFLLTNFMLLRALHRQGKAQVPA